MDLKETDRLLEKYLSEQCTAEEKTRIEEWLDSYESKKNAWADSGVTERMQRVEQGRERLAASLADSRSGSDPARHVVSGRGKWSTWARAAAAVVLIAFSASLYFSLKNELGQETPAEQDSASHQTDLTPGTDKAILTLSDGSRIALQDTTARQLASQGSTTIDMTENGQVIYTNNDASGRQTIVYNTIETPKGGQFQVILPDNTKVWLNSVSSIRFPTVFNGPERKVTITGEAYFEVATNEQKPFIVTSGTQTVKVLGTHFNINAYPDERGIKTTLLEGAVTVSDGKDSVLLHPGQQSLTAPGTGNIQVNTVSTDATVAWKNGFFQIQNADIQTIMRQAARWYDVEIRYEGRIPDQQFSGKIRRDVNASQLLEMLGYFDVQFRIEGKKIIVIN